MIWSARGEADHVGIVERVENNTIYTIDENAELPDAVRLCDYPIGGGKSEDLVYWQLDRIKNVSHRETHFLFPPFVYFSADGGGSSSSHINQQ